MRGLLLDTNLLVLLLVGSVGEDAIVRHKRTRVYDGASFRVLVHHTRQARHLLTTPHILTETSNLVRQCGEPLRGAVSALFVAFVGLADEVSQGARVIVLRSDHARLGFADAGVLAAQSGDVILMTDDNALYLSSLAEGRPAINFAHFREAAG